MRVEKRHYVDASQPDADGTPEYRYAYTIHRVVEGDSCLVARGYDDTPTQAHLLRLDVAAGSRALVVSALKTPLAAAAIGHLHVEGRRELSWLDPDSDTGYAAVPDALIARR